MTVAANGGDYTEIMQNTTGIVFLGTPHNGSKLADRSALIPYLQQLRIARGDLITQL